MSPVIHSGEALAFETLSRARSVLDDALRVEGADLYDKATHGPITRAAIAYRNAILGLSEEVLRGEAKTQRILEFDGDKP